MARLAIEVMGEKIDDDEVTIAQQQKLIGELRLALASAEKWLLMERLNAAVLRGYVSSQSGQSALPAEQISTGKGLVH